MKKAVIGILILGSMIFGVLPCFAATEGNILVGSDEAEEIMPDIDLILEGVRGFHITQEDIEENMDKAIRDYGDINIFQNNIKTADEMKEFLNDANYGYILPVFNKKDGDYELRISKGRPLREGANLTEEGKEYVRKREGRWCVPAVGAYEVEEDSPLIDYQSSMESFFRCYGIENSETFFVAGQSYISAITAICFTDEGEKEDDGPYYIAMSRVDPNAQTKEEFEDAVFTFDEIKEYAYKDNAGGGGMGGTNSGSVSFWIIIPAATVLAAAVVVVIVVRKRHQNNYG